MGADRVFGDVQVDGRGLGASPAEKTVQNVKLGCGQLESRSHGRHGLGAGRQLFSQSNNSEGLARRAVEVDREPAAVPLTQDGATARALAGDLSNAREEPRVAVTGSEFQSACAGGRELAVLQGGFSGGIGGQEVSVAVDQESGCGVQGEPPVAGKVGPRPFFGPIALLGPCAHLSNSRRDLQIVSGDRHPAFHAKIVRGRHCIAPVD